MITQFGTYQGMYEISSMYICYALRYYVWRQFAIRKF